MGLPLEFFRVKTRQTATAEFNFSFKSVLSTMDSQIRVTEKTFQRPRIKKADMNAEVSTEAIEIITMQIDKHIASNNFEVAARNVKKMMDKKFGPHWHCVIGEG